MSYSIDTSSLIDASLLYPPDVFPGVWELMEEMIAQGELVASKQVYVELSQKEDSLLEWAKCHDSMFVEVDEETQEIVKSLPDLEKLVDPNKAREDADPFVIALAKREGRAVVSEERPSGTPANKLKIPDVCERVSVPCMRLLEMLRETGKAF